MSKTPTAHIHLDERGVAWIDASIEEQLREIEALRAQAGESPVRQRLRAWGRLP